MKKRIATALLAVFVMAFLLSSAPSVRAEAAADYSDVSMEQWFFQPIVYCTEMGMMNGIGNGTFAPDAQVNRAMFVTILYRLAGSPDAGSSGFTDVPMGRYYTRAVAWAKENGIVNGTSKTTFSPDDPITRQDMACMIARYAIAIDAEFLDGPQAEQWFQDMDTTSNYARASVELVCRTGLFIGDPEGNFRPHASATRAEAAMVFMRLGLNLDRIPCQAVLETESGSFTMSVDDTIRLYWELATLDYVSDAYPEYVATHTVKLWNGTFRFDFSEESFYYGVGYSYGDNYAGASDVDPYMIRGIYDLLLSYTG